jgi:hypothetical protein
LICQRVRPDIGSGVIVDVGRMGVGVALGIWVLEGKGLELGEVAVSPGSWVVTDPQADSRSRKIESLKRCLDGIRGIVPEAGN